MFKTNVTFLIAQSLHVRFESTKERCMAVYKHAEKWLVCIGLLIVCLWTGGGALASQAQDGQDSAASQMLPAANEATVYLGDDAAVKEGFTTHLPLLVTEFIPGGDGNEDNYWFTRMRLTVYDHPGENNLSMAPTANIPMHVRLLSDWENEDRQKLDYFMRLYDNTGNPAAYSLLGMEGSSEYFLIGGMYDRSLLRNYLGYTLAGEIMDDAPSVRYCEVLQREGDDYLYKGVYLLVERKTAPNTVALRRDVAPDDLWLETYAARVDPEEGRWVYPFLEETIEDQALWDLAGKLSTVEEVILSDDLNTFSQYSRLIDARSFADFFIINEVMGNYAAKGNAYYTLNTRRNVLSMGPVWDFERALDNEVDEPMEIWDIPFAEETLFQRLLQSKSFIETLRQHYIAARQNVLNQAHYYALIDDAVAQLGDAALRDWHVWDAYFAENPDTQPQPVDTFTYLHADVRSAAQFSRAPKTHAQEVVKLKYLLRDHDINMAYQFSQLETNAGSDLKGTESSYVRNTWWFVAFLAVLFLSIRIGHRYAKQV